MIKSSNFIEDQSNYNSFTLYELQGPFHQPETSDNVSKNLNLKGLEYLETLIHINEDVFTEKENSYLASFPESPTPITHYPNDINEGMTKLNLKFFLTKKTRRKSGEVDNNNDIENRKVRRRNRKEDFDNILVKIQVHFINFIINVSNDIIKFIFKKQKYSFKQIDYKYKRNASFENFNKLKEVPIKEILSKEISSKYKLIPKSTNSDILSIVTSSTQWLNNFFNINYLEFFSIYYNNCKPLKKIEFQGNKIFLSPKTKSFYALLRKNKSLKELIISVVQDAYFNGNKNITQKFVVTKQEETKKEK